MKSVTLSKICSGTGAFLLFLQNLLEYLFTEDFPQIPFELRSLRISYMWISEYRSQDLKIYLHSYSYCNAMINISTLGGCSPVQNQLKTISSDRFNIGNNALRYKNAYIILSKCLCYILLNFDQFVAGQISLFSLIPQKFHDIFQKFLNTNQMCDFY